MSGVINILPESVSNILAAGEVVERPASVAKELIENSIDSGAKKIVVRVKGGGRRSLVITDNGKGMSQEDAVLSTQRHATSKIQNERDLFSISTYGFRGEALASIASVSKMNILSCQPGAETGTEVVIKAGEIVDVKQTSPVPGTTVNIQSLFYNVPARLKFLKSDTTENGHINRTVVTQALARHSIGFNLWVDSRQVHDFPPTATPLERISAVAGGEISGNLLSLSAERDGLTLSGFVSKPVYTRRSKNHQYIFLNSRFVKDRTITRAIYEAFRNVIPRDRHPVFYIYLEIAPGAVDVNVHPAKLEVRFSRSQEVFEFVFYAISKSLKGLCQNNLSSAYEEEASLSSSEGPGSLVSFSGVGEEVANSVLTPESLETQEPLFEYSSGGNPPPRKGLPELSDTLFQPLSTEEVKPLASLDPLSVKIVGQLFNSLIVIESHGRMVLIDQHAAHERVLFQMILSKVREGTMEVQELLFPVHVELSSEELPVISRHGKELESIGVSVEFFGGKTCIIRSLPAILSKEDPKEVLMDILDLLSVKKGKDSYETVLDRMIQAAACRGAVKAGQSLDIAEQKGIVSTLFSENVLSTCPHGRPFMVSMEKDSIMRKFLRS